MSVTRFLSFTAAGNHLAQAYEELEVVADLFADSPRRGDAVAASDVASLAVSFAKFETDLDQLVEKAEELRHRVRSELVDCEWKAVAS